MITIDKAMEIARAELADEIRKGGVTTLYGYNDHWKANCLFPDGSTPDDHVPRMLRIDAVDGSVSVL